MDLVGRTEAEFLVSADTLAGEVRIGGGETPAMGLVADAVAELQSACPLMRFSLYSGNAEDVHIAWKRYREFSPAASVFLDKIRELWS